MKTKDRKRERGREKEILKEKNSRKKKVYKALIRNKAQKEKLKDK